MAVMAAACLTADPKACGGEPAGCPLKNVVSGCIGRALVLKSELNITAEQKAKIRDVLVRHKARIAETVKAVGERHVALRNAVLTGKDEATIRAAADELGKAISDAAVKASKLRNEIEPILTEEQKQAIGKFLAENDAAIGKFLDEVAKSK